ncbi:MAG: hypothetical protein ACLR0U_26620 [Enterocloster clostridioformis]
MTASPIPPPASGMKVGAGLGSAIVGWGTGLGKLQRQAGCPDSRNRVSHQNPVYGEFPLSCFQRG